MANLGGVPESGDLSSGDTTALETTGITENNLARSPHYSARMSSTSGDEALFIVVQSGYEEEAVAALVSDVMETAMPFAVTRSGVLNLEPGQSPSLTFPTDDFNASLCRLAAIDIFRTPATEGEAREIDLELPGTNTQCTVSLTRYGKDLVSRSTFSRAPGFGEVSPLPLESAPSASLVSFGSHAVICVPQSGDSSLERAEAIIRETHPRGYPAVTVVFYGSPHERDISIASYSWNSRSDIVTTQTGSEEAALAVLLLLTGESGESSSRSMTNRAGGLIECYVDGATAQFGVDGPVKSQEPFFATDAEARVQEVAKKITPRTLKGFQDRLPKAALQKEKMVRVLTDVFKSFGYVPIETPHLEYTEVLIGEASGDIQKQLYRFRDQGDRDVSLRFDQTVPLARFVAQHINEVGAPFKRYVVGNVFRGESPQAGRYREFTQCDFDFIGTSSLESDTEIVQVIGSSLRGLGIEDFTIAINNRKIMNGLGASLGLGDRIPDMLRVVDKLGKIGPDEVVAQLIRDVGLTRGQAGEVLTFCSLRQEQGQQADFFETLAPYKERHPMIKEGIEELEKVFSLLAHSSLSPNQYSADLSIARGLGYYTGIVFETTLNALPGIGSVCSGGRFDNLVETFSNDSLPGVGASVGLDRLMAALEQLGITQGTSTSADVLLVQFGPEHSGEVIGLADKLRALGVNAEVYPDPTVKLGKQISFAGKRGHPYAIFLGGDEIAQGIYKVRNLTDRSEVVMHSPEEFADFLKRD